MVAPGFGAPAGESAVIGNVLISQNIEKRVHQGVEMNNNKRLAIDQSCPSEVDNPTPPFAPDCYCNLLKFKREKGGELEGLT